MPRPIIYINSWPGVGKHTIAKELEKLMGGEERVVHNHLHIDLAGAILPRSSPDYLPLRHQLRAALFNTLATSSDTFNQTYIFTDFQSTDPTGTSVANEYLHLSQTRNSSFIPIILTCSLPENEKRMRSAERLKLVEEEGRGMLLDAKMLREMRRRKDVYRFGCKEELVLDVSGLEAGEAAGRIWAHVRGVIGDDEVTSVSN